MATGNKGVAADTCFQKDANVETCAWRDVALTGGEFVERLPSNESILIVDEFYPSISFLKYRSRILGYYEAQADGAVELQQPVLRLPATLIPVFT